MRPGVEWRPEAVRRTDARRSEKLVLDIYPPSPHESRMRKLTPALSLHFLRILIVYVFVCMTVNLSLCLSSRFL